MVSVHSVPSFRISRRKSQGRLADLGLIAGGDDPPDQRLDVDFGKGARIPDQVRRAVGVRLDREAAHDLPRAVVVLVDNHVAVTGRLRVLGEQDDDPRLPHIPNRTRNPVERLAIGIFCQVHQRDDGATRSLRERGQGAEHAAIGIAMAVDVRQVGVQHVEGQQLDPAARISISRSARSVPSEKNPT